MNISHLFSYFACARFFSLELFCFLLHSFLCLSYFFFSVVFIRCKWKSCNGIGSKSSSNVWWNIYHSATSEVESIELVEREQRAKINLNWNKIEIRLKIISIWSWCFSFCNLARMCGGMGWDGMRNSFSTRHLIIRRAEKYLLIQQINNFEYKIEIIWCNRNHQVSIEIKLTIYFVRMLVKQMKLFLSRERKRDIYPKQLCSTKRIDH